MANESARGHESDEAADAEFDALLERSSLGTPAARELRSRTSASDVVRMRETAVSRDDGTARRVQRSDGIIEDRVTAALDGDRLAVERLLSNVRPLVVAYCRSRVAGTRTGIDPDNLAQDICLTALKSLAAYRDQEKPFLAWVYTIAAQNVKTTLRSIEQSDPERLEWTDTTQVNADQADTGVQDGGQQEMRQLRRNLGNVLRDDRILNTISPQQREILMLRGVVGLSVDETAEAVEVGSGTVRVQLRRALIKLTAARDASATDDSGPAVKDRARGKTDIEAISSLFGTKKEDQP